MNSLTKLKLRLVAERILRRRALKGVVLTDEMLDRLASVAYRIKYGEDPNEDPLDYDPLVLDNRLWVPRWMITDSEWHKEGTYARLNPLDLMEKCEYENVERSGTEWVTNAEGETEQVAVEEVVKIRSYRVVSDQIGFSRGNIQLLETYFDHLQWDDRRADVPMPVDLKFISDIKDEDRRRDAMSARPDKYAKNGDTVIEPATLRPDQKQAITKLIKARGGIVKADTGWGKTLSSEYGICQIGQTTLILVEEIQIGRGWVEEFYRHTNIALLEEELDCELIGIYGKTGPKGYFWPCITVATYQSFIHNEVLREHRDTFGCVWVDEVDRAAATCFSKVANYLNPKVRAGCTATVNRNDGLEGLVFDIIGPVVAHGVEKMMSCDVHFVQTDVNIPMFKGATWWTKSISHLVGTEAKPGDQMYFDLARKLIVKLVKKGRNVLVICDRNAFLKRMKEALNPHERKDGLIEAFWDEQLVRLLIGESDRDGVIKQARSGQTRVVLGQSKLLRRGINVPSWDACILTTPMSGWSKQTRKLPMDQRIPNPELQQLAGRIRRRKEGKKRPLLFDLVAGGQNYYIENTARGRRGAYEHMGFHIRNTLTVADLAPEMNRHRSKWED